MMALTLPLQLLPLFFQQLFLSLQLGLGFPQLLRT